MGLTAMTLLSNSKQTKGLREKLLHSFESLADKAHSFEDLAHSAADTWDENVSPWINKIEDMIDSLNEQGERHTRRNGTSHSQPLDTILDWASAAAQIYQSLKK